MIIKAKHMKPPIKNMTPEDFDKICKILFPNYIELNYANDKFYNPCYELKTNYYNNQYIIMYTNSLSTSLYEIGNGAGALSYVADEDPLDCIKWFGKQNPNPTEITKKEYDTHPYNTNILNKLREKYNRQDKIATQNGKVIQTKTYEFSESQLKRMDKALKTGKPQ